MTPAGQTLAAPVGVFGGTFDPVHNGHLRAALEVLDSCGLAAMRLVPSGQPPHRNRPVAGPEERLRLLRVATAGEPRFAVDESELRRAGPSYTIDTLAVLRTALHPQPLCLVLGADAFLGLPDWHRWRELPDLAHLVVMHRPGAPLRAEGELAQLLAARHSDDVGDLRRRSAGVVRLQPVTQLDISSTAIRTLVRDGRDPRYLVPDAVRDLLVSSSSYRHSVEVQVRA